jgi:hypothetical protein
MNALESSQKLVESNGCSKFAIVSTRPVRSCEMLNEKSPTAPEGSAAELC